MAIQMVGTFSFGMFNSSHSFNIRGTKIPASVVESMSIISNIGTPTTAALLEKYFPSKTFEVNREPIKKREGECFIQAVFLNKSGGKVSTPEEVEGLEPKRDYDFEFYLIEVLE